MAKKKEYSSLLNVHNLQAATVWSISNCPLDGGERSTKTEAGIRRPKMDYFLVNLIGKKLRHACC
jgi:hypothetical protein